VCEGKTENKEKNTKAEQSAVNAFSTCKKEKNNNGSCRRSRPTICGSWGSVAPPGPYKIFALYNFILFLKKTQWEPSLCQTFEGYI
jgi:hypothetical protein